ncbi:hypothetical protein KCP76_19085 [Salmonella enterica subsp. enterica serovar Weltevreden]|nr:hypothetical protein KCP76_19085 [Salmonella enterica subsp. enterica serovar Weltevreden]
MFPWFRRATRFCGGRPIFARRAVVGASLSRSMKRFHNASSYRVTLTTAFDRVIDGCANHRDEGTSITRAWY